MKQEEKELVLKDLCARLPYGVKLRYVEDLVVKKESHTITLNNIYLEHIINGDADIKPYLRPLSSMTEEEKEEYRKACELDTEILSKHPMDETPFPALYNSQDWLNAHHFDYRGLIERGLALVAPEDMYK